MRRSLTHHVDAPRRRRTSRNVIPHRLDPLLRPRSIAVVGASARSETPGNEVLVNLRKGGFSGEVYAVNPGTDSIDGLRSYRSLSDLPVVVQHVVFAVSDHRIEAALIDAIAHGARAATIMSQLIIADDSEPLLQQRVAALIRESGMLVCGANAMGFYNCRDGVWVCGCIQCRQVYTKANANVLPREASSHHT